MISNSKGGRGGRAKASDGLTLLILHRVILLIEVAEQTDVLAEEFVERHHCVADAEDECVHAEIVIRMQFSLILE